MAESKRSDALDWFRGLAVVLMAVANYLSGWGGTPAALEHAPDVGLTVADFIAPMFVFAIGLTYGRSFRKRYALGPAKAYGHFATRYLALLGIGAFLSAGGSAIADIPSDWGVLQAIGVAGLLCLPFIRLKPWARLGAGLALLVCYQIAMDKWFLDSVLAGAHGGFIGSVSWGAMLLLSGALGDLFERGKKPYLLSSLLLCALAVGAAFLFPVSKHRVSASFVLITLAASALFYFALEELSRLRIPRGPLAAIGENPLALYVLHMLLLGVVAAPSALWWYAEAPAWLMALELAALLAALVLTALWLKKRRIVIKL